MLLKNSTSTKAQLSNNIHIATFYLLSFLILVILISQLNLVQSDLPCCANTEIEKSNFELDTDLILISSLTQISSHYSISDKTDHSISINAQSNYLLKPNTRAPPSFS